MLRRFTFKFSAWQPMRNPFFTPAVKIQFLNITE